MTSSPPAGDPVAGCRIARMSNRMIAAIMDGIFLATVCTVTGMAAFVRMGGFPLTSAKALLGVGVTFALATAYFWLCEGLFGATLGKAAAGIQVRRITGGRCGLGPSLVRNLLRFVDALGGYLFGFILASFSKLRQRLGDQVAGTIVVERKLSRTARTALVISWFEVFGVGLTGAYMLHRGMPVADEPVIPVVKTLPALPPSATPASPRTLQALDFAFVENYVGPERPALPYRPGDTVYLRYDLAGYATGADGRPNLLIKGLAFDPNGRPLQDQWVSVFNGTPGAGATLRGTFNVKLATFVPSGSYLIRIQVHDRLQNTDLEIAPSFRVEALAVRPAEQLALRDIEMSLSRDGPALGVPVLTGAGTVHMRCRLFGMQFQGNHVDGRIALRVIGPGGKVVFDKEDYIDIKASVADHPAAFWLPVHGSLNVPANLAKGTYTEQYTVVDNIGRRQIGRETAFQVE